MKNKKSFVLMFSILCLFVFASSFAIVDAKKNGNDKKTSQSAKKNDKSKEIKNYEKPKNDQSNAQIHKNKSTGVSDELKSTAKKEKKGNGKIKEGVSEEMSEEELAEEMEEVAQEVADSSEETAEAIEEVESRNKFKRLLIGTDYKNLGQLRSSLVKNENQIRKLTRIAGDMEGGEIDASVDEQLVALMQERERIKAVIQENQEGFSLLGWAVKLFGGYTEEEIDQDNEEQLEEDVLEVLEDKEDVKEEGGEDEGSEQ